MSSLDKQAYISIQSWSDESLRWNPVDYGGINNLILPADEVWLPELSLLNSAEGMKDLSLTLKASSR